MKTLTVNRIPKIGEVVVGVIPGINCFNCPELIRVGRVTNNTEVNKGCLLINLFTNINEITGRVNKQDNFGNAFLYNYQITPIWN
jgi:hypothetical protein